MPDGDCRCGKSCTGSDGNSELLEKSGLATPPCHSSRLVMMAGALAALAPFLSVARPKSGTTMQGSMSATATDEDSLCEALSFLRPFLFFFFFPLVFCTTGCCCMEAEATVGGATRVGGGSSATAGMPSSMGQHTPMGGVGWYRHWYCIV